MRFLRRFARDRVGVAFAVVLVAIYAVALLARVLAPEDPLAVNLSRGLQPPSWQNWLGTDQFGRDVLSRVILATQVSAKVTGLAAAFAVAVGVPLGMLVGYWGGWLESLVMRATDMLLIFPIIMLSIVIVVIAGPSEHGIVVALGLSQAPTFVRIARGVTMAVRQELYVEAAVAAGAGRISILVHHVWPNIAAPIIVQATLTLPVFVLNASALSYLGLGVQPPTPEWGQMLNEAKEFLITAPHLLIGPATALILFVLSANLVGDAVQETLDPRLNRRR